MSQPDPNPPNPPELTLPILWVLYDSKMKLQIRKRPTRRVGDRLQSDLSTLSGLEPTLDLGIGCSTNCFRPKDVAPARGYRCDKRGQCIMVQNIRNLKMKTLCRLDINSFNAPFLAVFESLVSADAEKIKQKQLLSRLEKLVTQEWPDARLDTYGSCNNSFVFSNSDIDVSLAMENKDVSKGQIVLKLADILKSKNFQNVKVLPYARIPVLKFTDSVTSISTDFCSNNALAVVNTLRQLVFIVKHWAKSRRVNDTYQGTLPSYAYVLMCINFLQQKRPAILPCLQIMETTFSKSVGTLWNVLISIKLEKLCNFGVGNGESIAQLVWGFFHYWAYCHDYENDVIPV
ncbi:RNA uridylyltransferase [Handroanthus impetiginosus]|uniref:RNA uridylyltransferase n=1 Tax=Handroanthus impetiginosus TaxID=429701 RepID=A0A2G9HD68_9LAMI|nr:RNA uridylyltransferase [Handroanthus impetiginosus]